VLDLWGLLSSEHASLIRRVSDSIQNTVEQPFHACAVDHLPCQSYNCHDAAPWQFCFDLLAFWDTVHTIWRWLREQTGDRANEEHSRRGDRTGRPSAMSTVAEDAASRGGMMHDSFHGTR